MKNIIIGVIISASIGAFAQHCYDATRVQSCAFFSQAGIIGDSVFMVVKCSSDKAADLRAEKK